MEQIKQAVISALKSAGISAVERTSRGILPRVTGPRTAVSLKACTAQGAGFADYLGTVSTEDGGTAERYGRKISGTLAVRIFAPHCEQADGTAERVMAVLSDMEGFRMGQIVREEPVFDAKADCFTAEVRAEFSVWLFAQTAEDEEEFLDFKLEGVWK